MMQNKKINCQLVCKVGAAIGTKNKTRKIMLKLILVLICKQNQINPIKTLVISVEQATQVNQNLKLK